MTYLLDTCVVSEPMKKRPDPRVLAWWSEHDEGQFYLSAVTIGELRKGIAALGETRRKRELEAWLQELEIRYAGRIKAYNVSVAEVWGDAVAAAERMGCPAAVLDSLIAATAVTDDMTLVTRNVRDFRHLGVRVLNPFDAPSES